MAVACSCVASYIHNFKAVLVCRAAQSLVIHNGLRLSGTGLRPSMSLMFCLKNVSNSEVVCRNQKSYSTAKSLSADVWRQCSVSIRLHQHASKIKSPALVYLVNWTIMEVILICSSTVLRDITEKLLTLAGLHSGPEATEKLFVGYEETGMSPQSMLCFVLSDRLSCRHQWLADGHRETPQILGETQPTRGPFCSLTRSLSFSLLMCGLILIIYQSPCKKRAPLTSWETATNSAQL